MSEKPPKKKKSLSKAIKKNPGKGKTVKNVSSKKGEAFWGEIKSVKVKDLWKGTEALPVYGSYPSFTTICASICSAGHTATTGFGGCC
jgi:hypothetical protein